MFRLGSALLVILAVALGLLIGSLNAERVSLDLLWVRLDWPLGLLIVAALALGVLLGLLLSYFLQVLPTRLSLRRQLRAGTAGTPGKSLGDDG